MFSSLVHWFAPRPRRGTLFWPILIAGAPGNSPSGHPGAVKGHPGELKGPCIQSAHLVFGVQPAIRDEAKCVDGDAADESH